MEYSMIDIDLVWRIIVLFTCFCLYVVPNVEFRYKLSNEGGNTHFRKLHHIKSLETIGSDE